MEWRRVILVHTWYTKKIGPQLIELTDGLQWLAMLNRSRPLKPKLRTGSTKRPPRLRRSGIATWLTAGFRSWAPVCTSWFGMMDASTGKQAPHAILRLMTLLVSRIFMVFSER